MLNIALAGASQSSHQRSHPEGRLTFAGMSKFTAVILTALLLAVVTSAAPGRKLLSANSVTAEQMEHQRILAELEEVHQLRERMLQQGQLCPHASQILRLCAQPACLVPSYLRQLPASSTCSPLMPSQGRLVKKATYDMVTDLQIHVACLLDVLVVLMELHICDTAIGSPMWA